MSSVGTWKTLGDNPTPTELNPTLRRYPTKVAPARSSHGSHRTAAVGPPWTVLVLGQCVVVADDQRPAPALTSAQGTILSRLALAGDEPVSLDALAAAVWGSEPPSTATAALHNQISRIRRTLGAEAVITVAGRYLLGCPTDRDQAEHGLHAASHALGSDDPARARAAAEHALDQWRGTPLEDLGELPAAVRERGRLEEIRRSLANLRLRAAIAEGSHAWAVPEAERLVADAPFDEHRWVLLIQALELAGRRGDALGAFERSRRTLAEGLGLSPGPALLAAEAAVLRDPEARRRGGPGRLIGQGALVDEALDLLGQSKVVVLTGEPGAGKSRVLDEVCSQLRRRGSVVGRCAVSWHPASAIATLTDLAEDLGSELDPRLPPLVAFRTTIEQRVPEGSGARGDGTTELVLCIDDLDRAGPTSMAALSDVMDLGGVQLIATATEPEQLTPALERRELSVPALDQNEVAELVASRADVDRPDPVLVAWLQQMSGGNPMLVEYLLEHPPGLTHDPVASPELRELIRARVRRLGASSLGALEVAAVCGERSDAELLGALASRAGIDGAIAAALLEEYVDESGTAWIVFRHGAVQRTIYDDLPPGRRTEIHHHAGKVLERLGAPAATVAAHTVAAAFDPASAARHCIDAARAATSVGAHDDAATWFHRAFEMSSTAETAGIEGSALARVESMVGRGDALRLAGSTEQEAALFAAADAAFELGDADLVGAAAFAVLQLGATTESGSLHADAIDIADRALAIVTDPDQQARISAAASLTHSMTGATDRCRQLFMVAERLATSDEARRQVLPFAYLGMGHPADLATRERLTDELIERGRRADDPVALFEGYQLSFSVGLTRQRGDQVRHALAEQAELVVRVGDVGRRWQLEYQLAALAHLEGELDEAERHAETALAMFGDVSPSRAFAVYGAQILPVRLAQDRLSELLETLESLVADQPGVPAWHAALALGIAPSDPDRAHVHARAALDDVPEDFTWLAAHVIGGRAAAAVGETALCDAYMERLTPWSGLGCWQGTCSYGPIDTVLAQLAEATGRVDDATLLATAALDQAERLGAPGFAAEPRRLLRHRK